MPAKIVDFKKHFAKHVKLMPSGCIEWQRYRANTGYGAVLFRGKIQNTHRVAWILANGEIPNGMCVCHKCDNRPCVNVDHLFLGTDADNMRDKSAKGRWRGGDRRGEKHSMCKLTEQQVHEIRVAKGSQVKIAKQYGISQTQVSDIKLRNCWKHI